MQSLGAVVGHLDVVLAQFQGVAQALGSVHIVLDDEYPATDWFCLTWGRSGLADFAGKKRQLDHELRSLAQPIAMRADLAAVHLDETLDER